MKIFVFSISSEVSKNLYFHENSRFQNSESFRSPQKFPDPGYFTEISKISYFWKILVFNIYIEILKISYFFENFWI